MFDRKVLPVQPRSRDLLERVAVEVLQREFPSCLKRPTPLPVLDLIDIVAHRKYGFRLEVAQLPYGIEGATDVMDKTITISAEVYTGLESGVARPRFSGSHEYAHVELHRHEFARAQASSVRGVRPAFARRRDLKPYVDPEWQADWLAAALLMPASMVLKLIREFEGLDPIQPMIESFGVSGVAATKRLENLARLWPRNFALEQVS